MKEKGIISCNRILFLHTMLFLLINPSFQILTGPTINGHLESKTSSTSSTKKTEELTSEMKYRWKLIVQTKINFLNLKYKDILNNFGINLSTVYDYLDEEKWTNLRKDFCDFSEKMDHPNLIDLCEHFKVLPDYKRIIEIMKKEDQISEFNKEIANVEKSNHRPFIVNKNASRSLMKKEMRDLWNVLESKRKNKEKKTSKKKVGKQNFMERKLKSLVENAQLNG